MSEFCLGSPIDQSYKITNDFLTNKVTLSEETWATVLVMVGSGMGTRDIWYCKETNEYVQNEDAGQSTQLATMDSHM